VSQDDYDCQACGACCISTWDVEAYVYVDDKDIRRLRLAYDPQAVKNMIALPDDIYERGLATKKNSQGHIVCTALDGLVKEECSCGIYEARPRACREFAPPCCKADLGIRQ
jgi:Fe-S-cluster containining protein